MIGSGIYSSDRTLVVDCPECGFDWEADFATDDRGYVEDLMVCPECQEEFTFSREGHEDDYEDDDASFDK